MPEWCPECHAMLPEGLEECPRCHAVLKPQNQSSYGWTELFQYSAVIIGVMLIPTILIIILGIICVNSFR